MIIMGIDYGFGLTNIDNESNIRFGVISMHEVCQAWCDSSEGEYAAPERSDCDCPECGHNDGDQHDWGDDLVCEECGHDWELESPDCVEPIAHNCTDSEYEARQSNDDSDIFITKSPYFTICGFCSPCAPGAGYLMTRSDDCRAYCFGHEWFESGRAPYPVYKVCPDSEYPEIVWPKFEESDDMGDDIADYLDSIGFDEIKIKHELIESIIRSQTN